jgi:hypothetical protein
MNSMLAFPAKRCIKGYYGSIPTLDLSPGFWLSEDPFPECNPVPRPFPSTRGLEGSIHLHVRTTGGGWRLTSRAPSFCDLMLILTFAVHRERQDKRTETIPLHPAGLLGRIAILVSLISIFVYT